MGNAILPELSGDLKKIVHSGEYEPIRVSGGESGAAVFRLQSSSGSQPALFLKIDPHAQGEGILLRWLRGRVAVPECRMVRRIPDGRFALLTTAVHGLHPFHDGLGWSSQRRIEVMADAVRQFHAIPTDACPFMYTVAGLIEIAHANLTAGRVREDDFDAPRHGRSAADLFDELVATQPADPEYPVVAHGDLYPVNVLADPQTGAINAFIDVGRAGVSDRYRDLALVANAIQWHYDAALLTTFFDLLDIEPDYEKLRWYALLDEFF